MRPCLRASLYLTLAAALPAQKLTTLHSFSGADGANPLAALVQATDGNLYGVTAGGGSQGQGSIYRITTEGAFSSLYSFCSQPDCSDGSAPLGGLLQARNGNFYGTTWLGGAGGVGTVFEITAAGVLTILHSFCVGSCTDGSYPTAGLVEAPDGSFYGTNYWGPGAGWGTVFQITPSGDLTTIYEFCRHDGRCLIGANPEGLALAPNGDLFGSTFIGGPHGGAGTFFRLSPSGEALLLHNFCPASPCQDGGNPEGTAIPSTGGDFYGVAGGGEYNAGIIYQISPAGNFTFYNFKGGADGANPNAGLLQAADGNFYGTGMGGGAHHGGVIFKLTPSGELTPIYSFCSQPSCADGEAPVSRLIQTTDGDLYGTTLVGGANGQGTVFRLSLER